MNTAQQVQDAATPQQAMLAIAAALDRIEAAATTPAADPWATWQPSPTDLQAVTIFSDTGQIELCRKLLAAETDPDERRALEARLRLLEDSGRAPEAPDPGIRVQSVAGSGEVTVDIPPPSRERRDARRALDKFNSLYGYLSTKALTADEFAKAFAQGGPMWLYLGDRDAVMAMPADVRRAFIADIEQDSPQQAKEVARDILKDVAPGTPESLDRVYSS